jgi:hypothetical protein
MYKPGSYGLLILDIVFPKTKNRFDLSTEIREVDNKIKEHLLAAGPKLIEPFNRKKGGALPILYNEDFICIPIENEELVKQVDKMIK